MTASVIFADDIRSEDSGKALLVGVYGSDLVISDPAPTPFPINTWVRITGPAQTIIKKINIIYLLDKIKIYEMSLNDGDLQALDRAFAEQVKMFALIEQEFGKIEDALLAHGSVKLLVPISKAVSVLNAIVDVGYGPIAAGTLPIRWMPSVQTVSVEDDN